MVAGFLGGCWELDLCFLCEQQEVFYPQGHLPKPSLLFLETEFHSTAQTVLES